MTVVINGTTGITDVNGTAAAPAITGTDTDTGLYFGTNLLGLATGGTNALYIDSSQNVGIGTTSPTAQLHQYLASGTTYRQISNGSVNLTEYASTAVSSCVYGTTSNHPLIFTTNNTERMRLDTSGNLLFNSGFGSVATAYGCRAWVNFNGTGTVAIRASGNVSSITDVNLGQYTVNLTTAMPDANYAVATGGSDIGTNVNVANNVYNLTTSSFAYQHVENNTGADASLLYAAVFR